MGSHAAVSRVLPARGRPRGPWAAAVVVAALTVFQSCFKAERAAGGPAGKEPPPPPPPRPPAPAVALPQVQQPASGGIDPSWLSSDTATKTATFQLIAGLTGDNGALNFNGFRDGRLTLTVPVGWTVQLHFINHDGMLPHSAEVIRAVRPLPPGPVPATFDRAVTVRLGEGIPPEGSDEVRFIANRVGSFLIFCGVPGHGAAGMWVRLKVSGAARLPSVAVTPDGKS